MANASGIDWYVHRVAASERYPADSLIDIQTKWSIPDLLHALRYLDMLAQHERDNAPDPDDAGS